MFPLLAHLSVQEVATGCSEPLPPYLGIILSVLNAQPLTPVCFVFPRRGDVPRLAAVLYCLNRLSTLDAQERTAGSERFVVGENVLVHPSREVFVYEGLDDEIDGYFRLGEVDRRSGEHDCRSSLTLKLPLSALKLLERTTRKMPKGRIASVGHLRHPDRAAIDLLLDRETYGNLGALKNQVLMLDSQSGFMEFTESLRLQPRPPAANMPVLKHLLPFGTIEQPGPQALPLLRKWDETSSSGEPVLAVTNSSEAVANLAITLPVRSRPILVNGLGRLKDLQSYDDLAQIQPMLLFADHDEEEMIHTLGSRGCRFWYLESQELLHGTCGTDSIGMLRSVDRWARNADSLVVDDEPCEDPIIDELFLMLDGLRVDVPDSDDGSVGRLFSWAWTSFGRVRGALQLPDPDARNRALVEIEAFRIDVNQHRAWMKPHVGQGLLSIAERLAACYCPESQLGRSKGTAAYRLLNESIRTGRTMALLAKSEGVVADIRRWICDRALPVSVPVFSIPSFPKTETYDRLICVSWPGGDTMSRIIETFATPRITLLGYPCERRWLKQSQSRFRRRAAVPVVTDDEKAGFLIRCDTPAIKWSVSVAESPATGQAGQIDPEIWEFERRLRGMRVGLAARPTDALETVPARYVRFSGDYYAFLTESHKVPIATDLASGRVRQNQALPERTVAEIRMGDFVVFPASGDRELVQELADRLLGSRATALRREAHLWRDALRKSGLTCEKFHGVAISLNMKRHLATMRYDPMLWTAGRVMLPRIRV